MSNYHQQVNDTILIIKQHPRTFEVKDLFASSFWKDHPEAACDMILWAYYDYGHKDEHLWKSIIEQDGMCPPELWVKALHTGLIPYYLHKHNIPPPKGVTFEDLWKKAIQEKLFGTIQFAAYSGYKNVVTFEDIVNAYESTEYDTFVLLMSYSPTSLRDRIAKCQIDQKIDLGDPKLKKELKTHGTNDLRIWWASKCP